MHCSPPLEKGGQGGFQKEQEMIGYRRDLKDKSRLLRCHATDSEEHLWARLRRKQLLGIHFYRQKPLGNYIVDFYAPKMKLVVEVDGSQHLQEEYLQKDEKRDQYLAGLGLYVLRFNSRKVLLETDAVVETIYQAVTERLKLKIPP
jgi:very-short-patch-repair endonuclease